jgi:hypothetical protein
MKTGILLRCAAGGLGLLLASGCAMDRYKHPATSPPREVLPPPAPTAPPRESDLLARAAAQPVATLEGEGWEALFDGRALRGWRVIDFVGGGRVEVVRGLIVLGAGDPFTGIVYTNPPPRLNYELALEAMRLSGSDFFCGLTFPVRESHCSLIVGGWGGSVVGLSSVDGMDASENETTQFIDFQTGRWYRIRLRVTEHKIEAWIEQKKVVNLTTTGRKISLRFGDIEKCVPLGISSWMTGAALREIKIRRLTAPDTPPE